MGWAKEIDISIVMIAGTLMFGVLSFAIILFYVAYQKRLLKQLDIHQKELLGAALQAQENERKRLSQDLHDEIGVKLSAIKLKIDEEETFKNFSYPEKIKNLLEETIQNTREVSKALSPAILEKFGLGKALNDLAEKMTTQKAVITFSGADSVKRIDKKTELGLYRITQELINNAIKHGKATNIEILLKVNLTSVYLEVSDNGSLFDISKIRNHTYKTTGIGLKNIESRLSVLDATIKYMTLKNQNINVIEVKTKETIND